MFVNEISFSHSNMKSWYGTTEELWFANWDLGGSYWHKPTPKAYSEFNPSNFGMSVRLNNARVGISTDQKYRLPLDSCMEL